MTYQRKTHDEIEVQQYSPGIGWECATGAATMQEARGYLKDYRQNAPEYQYRIKRVRVKNDPQTGS